MASVVGLIGFMGSGKTAAGHKAAGLQGWDFLDLDAEIVRRTGMGISALFATGEEGFRKEETAALAAVLRERANDALGPPLLLSLGGGVLTRNGNLDLLRDVPLVYLEVDTATAWRRVRGSDRPLARSRDAFDQLADLRRPLYEQWAAATIPTSGRTLAEVAADLGAWLVAWLADRRRNMNSASPESCP